MIGTSFVEAEVTKTTYVLFAKMSVECLLAHIFALIQNTKTLFHTLEAVST